MNEGVMESHHYPVAQFKQRSGTPRASLGVPASEQGLLHICNQGDEYGPRAKNGEFLSGLPCLACLAHWVAMGKSLKSVL